MPLWCDDFYVTPQGYYVIKVITNKVIASRCIKIITSRQGRHFLKMIGRALMLIFTTSKPFLPCNAIGIMLKFRNYW